MRKLFTLLLFFAFLSFPVIATAGTSVTFGWDYPSPPSDFSHFVLEKQGSDAWVDVSGAIDASAREYTAVDLPDGTYTWRLLAVDIGNLSTPSNEVTDTLEDVSGPPPPAENFRIITTVTVEIQNGNVVAQNIDTTIIPFD
jgi:hypothetical protein